MVAKVESGFGDDARKKLREIGWFVLVGLLRWLIDYLTKDNPGEDGEDAENQHE